MSAVSQGALSLDKTAGNSISNVSNCNSKPSASDLGNVVSEIRKPASPIAPPLESSIKTEEPISSTELLAELEGYLATHFGDLFEAFWSVMKYYSGDLGFDVDHEFREQSPLSSGGIDECDEAERERHQDLRREALRTQQKLEYMNKHMELKQESRQTLNMLSGG